MKLAVLSVTEQGAAVAKKIAEKRKVDLFFKRCHGKLPSNANFYDSLNKLVQTIFQQYDGFIFIMAAGIVVRVIAPLIVHKANDPAVIVINETSEHVVSLLSGHLGGANQLARDLADDLKAIPVITTATDVNGKLAADVLAKHLYCNITSFPLLKQFNARLCQGEEMAVFIDKRMKEKAYFHRRAAMLEVTLKEILPSELPDDGLRIFITNDKTSFSVPNCLIVSPGSFVVGMGCRKNTTLEDLEIALQSASSELDINLHYIQKISSSIVKQKEPGLLALAEKLNLPVQFYNNKEIETAIEQYGLQCSAFVKKQIGVGNVCEAAALLASQSKKLVLRKQKYKHVTIAIAWEN